MNPLSGIRGLAYTLFGTLVLSTLWVTSLTFLSAPTSATALLTEAGTKLLNPALVSKGVGITQATYTQLEAAARARPGQPLTLQIFKARVLGREIVGKSYDAAVELIYIRVASNYYEGGAAAAFTIPSNLASTLPNFALFDPNSFPLFPGGPSAAQLPPFAQPFFTFVGLTPQTFTRAGHQHLLGLLPWFWIALGVLGVLAVVLNDTEQKLSALAWGIVHGTWPAVMWLLILWGLTIAFASRAAPYVGLLGLVSRAFLPVYGVAFGLGLGAVLALKLMPKQARQTAGAPQMAMPAGLGALARLEAEKLSGGHPPTTEPERPQE